MLESLAGNFLSSRTAYLAIGAVTVMLVWSVDVMQIIALASRAFAAFYCLQCYVAAMTAWKTQPKHSDSNRRMLAIWFGFLSIVCAAITVLGLPSE